MKILLVKRLDSSVYAFRQSLDRFIKSYDRFISALESGQVYLSKRYSEKIAEMLENDDDEAIQQLIDEGEAEVYAASDFKPEFETALRSDLHTLKKVKGIWAGIKRDAKLLTFVKTLKSEKTLKGNKLLIFTESKETAQYLERELNKVFRGEVIAFAGGYGVAAREKVIQNFDAKARSPKDDYRILVSTEVLAEGVNLHRSNVVINYDIPWNPTRMMQRVGRVNRVDTTFDTIYTYNFFPTTQSNDAIKLKEAAEAKISAFISMLGADARLLMEGEEIESHELFNRLMSKATITGADGEEESELKYLQVIRDLRDNDPDLFNSIKQLPKKARTARGDGTGGCLLTYFRKGKLQKFFRSCPDEDSAELDFMAAAAMLEASPDTERGVIGKDFHDLLAGNKDAFDLCTDEEIAESTGAGNRGNAQRVLSILKSFRKDLRRLTDDQEQYLRTVMSRLESGSIPRQTLKNVHDAIQREFSGRAPDAVRLIGVLHRTISPELLESFVSERSSHAGKPREVILSEYFGGPQDG